MGPLEATGQLNFVSATIISNYLGFKHSLGQYCMLLLETKHYDRSQWQLNLRNFMRSLQTSLDMLDAQVEQIELHREGYLRKLFQLVGYLEEGFSLDHWRLLVVFLASYVQKCPLLNPSDRLAIIAYLRDKSVNS